MGFSVSTATAIIGVSLVMALEVAMGTMIPLYTDIQESYHDMKHRSVNEIQTDIIIQQVNAISNASLHDLNITVKNSGSTVLEKKYISLLIDGTITSFSGSSTYLYPESTDYYMVYGVSGSGEKKVKIVTQHGVSAYKNYTAP